jgi:hypothetical protein
MSASVLVSVFLLRSSRLGCSFFSGGGGGVPGRKRERIQS